MPSPYAHIVYSSHLIDLNEKNSDAFLRGTIFPDIRYLVHLDRSVTHRLGISLQDVLQEEDPWKAGWKFHNWLDEAWSDYYEQFGMPSESHAYDIRRTALKLMEDEQCQSELTRAEAVRVAESLRRGQEGADFGVSEADIAHWNNMVADLASTRDSDSARDYLLKAMNVPIEVREPVLKLKADLQKDQDWSRRVSDGRAQIIRLLNGES